MPTTIEELIRMGRVGVNLPPHTLRQVLEQKLSVSSESSSAQGQTIKTYRPQPDACPTCGFGPGEPGYLRNPDNLHGLSGLIPCPTCNAPKLAERARVQNQLEGDLRTKTFDNFAVTVDNRAAYNAAVQFVQAPRRWLTFWGPYGPGKTHLLAAITNRLPGVAKYFTFPDLVSHYRAAVGKGEVEDFYGRISRIPVLILDEIDKPDLKNWTREQTYRLFDYRYRNIDEFGTVLAMNDSPHDVNENFGYLFSRMKDERSSVIFVGGGDNRGKQSSLGELAGLQHPARLPYKDD